MEKRMNKALILSQIIMQYFVPHNLLSISNENPFFLKIENF